MIDMVRAARRIPGAAAGASWVSVGVSQGGHAVLFADELFTANPRVTEPARSVTIGNDPGRRTTSAPILLVQGDADAVVAPARTEALLGNLCAIGGSVDLEVLPGAGHDNAALRASMEHIEPWLAARFAGETPDSVCAAALAP